MDKVRPRVVAAARDLFAEQGFEATSVQQIVARAGVTKGALYHYFASKEDLLFEIYGSVLADQLRRLEQILAQGLPPRVALRAVITDVVQTTADHITAAAIISRESDRLNRDHWQVLRERWRRYLGLARGLIRDAQTSGAFAGDASPEIVSWAIFGLTSSMPTWYRPGGPKTPQQIADEVCDLIFNGLTPKETP